MTEKEKMLNGELYMPENDETLFDERIKCKTLCYQFNNLSPDKLDERKELIKKILCPEKNRLDADQILQEKWLRSKNKTFDSCKNVKMD